MTNFILILILWQFDIFSVNANRSSSAQFIIFLWFITAPNIGFRPEHSPLAPVAVCYSLADFSKHSHSSSPACCAYYMYIKISLRHRLITSEFYITVEADQWYNMVGILIWDSGLGHGTLGWSICDYNVDTIRRNNWTHTGALRNSRIDGHCGNLGTF